MDGVELEFTDDASNDRGLSPSREIRARGLRAIMEENMLDILYEIPSRKDIESEFSRRNA
jgi:ATP-dependent Clp protease ATP-binding subunit ClpX